MSKFGHLQAYNIQAVAVPLKLLMLDPSPTLMVFPATEANKAYTNEALKRQRAGAAMVQTGSISASMIKEMRDRDRELYAKYIVKSWDEDVTDDEGLPVPFSVENCTEYLHALPDWIFDHVRKFCTTPTHFTDGIANVEGITGN